MSMPESVQAILVLWPELPHKAGQQWPRLYWQLLDLLRAFETAADDEARAAISLDLLDILRQVPGGLEALRRVDRGELRVRRGEMAFATPDELGKRPDDATLKKPLDNILPPPTVTCYTDIYAPSRVGVGQRFPIIVGLTRSPTDEHEAAAIQAKLNELIQVVLTPRGPELLDEPVKTLRVTEEEGERAVFFLRATHIGSQSIIIDLYSESHLITSITHTLTTEEGEGTQPAKLPSRQITLGDYQAPFPDLVLRVCTQDRRLTYTLHYADTQERVIEGGQLRADPEAYRYQIMREIENLAQGLDVDGQPLQDKGLSSSEQFFKHLARIGYRLYDDLFCSELRREYAERIRGQVHTLQIVSDEPWIPWELVKPYDTGWSDDFLCLQYDLSRWMSGGQAPAAEIWVESLACVVPKDVGLSFAPVEKSFVCSLAQKFRLVNHAPTRRADVEALLESENPVHLWHFACHGDFDAQMPGNSPLILENGQRLRPNDLADPQIKRRFTEDRPFVFLNACRVGQSGLSLTGLGGWAARLVGEYRVGALVAPLWVVNDLVAYDFAQAFYNATLEPGMTVAAALRKARLQTKEMHPEDPTWLAYSLYAHPNARLKWGPMR